MHSFFRVVRSALRYRYSLAAAALCSLAIGALWGANIGTLYPFVEIVFKGESLQETLDRRIATTEEHRQALTAKLEQKQALAEEPGGKQRTELQDEIQALRNEIVLADRTLATSRRYEPWLDKYFPSDPFRSLVVVIGLLLLGTVFKSVLLMANIALIARVVHLTMADLQNTFFSRMLRRDLATFQQQASSGFVGHFVNEMRLVSAGLEAFFGSAVREPLKMVACLVGAAMISWQLLVLSMLCAPVGLLLLRLLSKTVKRATHHSLNLMAEQIRRLTESHGGFMTVKAFTLERKERSRFRHITQEIACMAQRLSLLFSMTKPISELMAMTITSVAILAGAYLVLNQETHLFGLRITDQPLNPASLLLFFGLLAGIADPARKLSGIFGQIYMGIIASQGVYAMMDAPSQLPRPENPLDFDGLEQGVSFENVRFGYNPNHPVLNDVSLQFAAGQRVALLGANGCGKSTLMKLLLRFYEPDSGCVRLDGHDLRHYHLRDVRRQIGWVTQETWLFDDTVADNIRCGRPSATDEEVVQAAKAAHAHEFITTSLADGYDTMVGEGGLRLSGGQRQRIALARVILRDPSILILDEATSEIDLVSEKLIHQSLAEFMQARTTFIITHRLSALALADVIVVMEQGRVVDVGSREELASRCEAFNRIVATQLQADSGQSAA